GPGWAPPQAATGRQAPAGGPRLSSTGHEVMRRGRSMVAFVLRFDFRNPPLAGTTMSERYAAGLDMMEWGDRLGAASILLSEHHGADDGYLPSAMAMAAAAAARTHTSRILVAAVVAGLHDPVRLAEQATVVDLLSDGRL